MPIALVDATHLVGDIVKALSNVQKITSAILLLPLQGVSLRRPITQGDALGYVLVAPAGRIAHNYCGSYFLHITNFANK